jgi:hypothetical protein
MVLMVPVLPVPIVRKQVVQICVAGTMFFVMKNNCASNARIPLKRVATNLVVVTIPPKQRGILLLKHVPVQPVGKEIIVMYPIAIVRPEVALLRPVVVLNRTTRKRAIQLRIVGNAMRDTLETNAKLCVQEVVAATVVGAKTVVNV